MEADRAQTDIFTAASPYRMALSAPGLVTDWTSDSELAKPHALDGRLNDNLDVMRGMNSESVDLTGFNSDESLPGAP